jgi:hypothetical protein
MSGASYFKYDHLKGACMNPLKLLVYRVLGREVVCDNYEARIIGYRLRNKLVITEFIVKGKNHE